MPDPIGKDEKTAIDVHAGDCEEAGKEAATGAEAKAGVGAEVESHPALISVKVVYALVEKQYVKELSIAPGATVQHAIDESGITSEIEGLVIDPKMVGVFGTKASLSQVLQDGDRVEIYRPLIADPKEVRRQRAIRQAKADQ